MSQLADWMRENAVPEYFASIELVSDDMRCKDEDGNVVFDYDTSNIQFRKNPNAIEDAGDNYQPSVNRPGSVGKCANGIIIDVNADSRGSTVLITKTNNGAVAAVFNYWTSSIPRLRSLTTGVHVCAVGDYGGSAADIRTLTFSISEKNQTQLNCFTTTPVEGVISYTPKAFYMPCSQVYDMTFGKFFANGKWYLTNGYWAIKDA
jgi:hypothetical protein